MSVNSDTKVIKSKKDMIISLFTSGISAVETIAAISGARPSYVGSVLQKEGLIDNYYDLYTSTGYPMNVYSKHFRGKLGFRDVEAAKNGVDTLENAYQYFGKIKDRPGQHHSLEMGLTMLDRSRWTGKLEEAEVYRQWLVSKLSTPLVERSEMRAVDPVPTVDGQDEVEELRKAA